MITATHINKTYTSGNQSFPVLKDITFSVTAGEFVAITGRSGSGKSTLLYQLSLLDIPTSGTITLNGINTHHLTSSERSEFRLKNLGYVFQDYALIPSLTGVENVMAPLLMQGVKQSEAEMKARAVMEQIGVCDKCDSLPNQMSGGQQQRVSIARAIAHDPIILFADEPTANLDSETSDQVLDAFLSLHKRGQTIIMVTHEPEYAAMTDRIITLSDGSITTDTPKKPVSRRIRKL